MTTVRGLVPGYGGGVPVVAATDASFIRPKNIGYGYVVSDGRWGLCSRPLMVDAPDGPSVVLVNELRAVHLLLTHHGGPVPDLLLVDNSSAVGYLRAWQRGDVYRMPAGYQLRKRRGGSSTPTLVLLARRLATIDVSMGIKHVRAHSGHLLNEAADSLARIAATSVRGGRRSRVRLVGPASSRARGESLVKAFLRSWSQATCCAPDC